MTPCKFCQKDTVYVPLIIKGGNGDKNFHKFDVYYCYDCAAEYVNWSDGISTHLYTTVNNRMYRWSQGNKSTTAQLWYVGKPGEPGKSPNKEMLLVKSFKDFPLVTPQNVERKIRFMLLFL